MTKLPDYSKYSLDELIDAYQHIDRYQFPERVKLIEEQIKKINPDVISVSKPTKPIEKPALEYKNTSVKKKTTLKLELADKTIISNPTEEDITAALKSLSSKKNQFAILSEGQLTYIQVAKNLMGGYYVEYMEESKRNHYSGVVDCLSLEFVNTLFHTYLQEGDKWKSMIKWKLIPQDGSGSQYSKWIYQIMSFLALPLIFLALVNRDENAELIRVFFEGMGINIGYPALVIAVVIIIFEREKIKNFGKIALRETLNIIFLVMLLVISLAFIIMI